VNPTLRLHTSDVVRLRCSEFQSAEMFAQDLLRARALKTRLLGELVGRYNWDSLLRLESGQNIWVEYYESPRVSHFCQAVNTALLRHSLATRLVIGFQARGQSVAVSFGRVN